MLKHFILIYSTLNTGDVSHAEAIFEKSSSQYAVSRFNIEANSTPDEIQAKMKQALTGINASETFCLAVGEKALQALKGLQESKIKDIYPELKIGASLHQYFDLISTLNQDAFLDFLAIPQPVVDNDNKNSVVQAVPNVHFTLGVPTKNPSKDALKKFYDEWNVANKPLTTDPAIVVMLPGDAPDQDGKIKLFTKESALELFNHIHLFWQWNGKSLKIIVQNGPRTGKFHQDGKVVCTHEYTKGSDPAVAVDEISQYFVKLLQDNGIPHEFFNFAIEVEGTNKKSNSVYNQLLFLAQANPENYFILPGESVSMLSQIPLYLKPEQVIVFKPSSMNEQHLAIFKEAYDRKHCCLFVPSTVTFKLPMVKMEKDDASNVAQALIECREKSTRKYKMGSL